MEVMHGKYGKGMGKGTQSVHALCKYANLPAPAYAHQAYWTLSFGIYTCFIPQRHDWWNHCPLVIDSISTISSPSLLQGELWEWSRGLAGGSWDWQEGVQGVLVRDGAENSNPLILRWALWATRPPFVGPKVTSLTLKHKKCYVVRAFFMWWELC